MNKGHIDREIFIAALLSGKNGVEAIVIAGSRATNNNSRSVVACRVLRIVKKNGSLENTIKEKMDLALNSINAQDLNSATLMQKVRTTESLVKIALKLDKK